MGTSNVTCFCVLACLVRISLNVCLPGISAGSSERNTFDVADLDSQQYEVQPGSHQSEYSLQLAGSNCHEDSDCRNNGTCTELPDDSRICSCKNGTSGSFCETVDQCEKNPYRCGNGTDVQCVYDVDRQKATCQCSNDTKLYDPYLKLCRTPCRRTQDCEPNGYCNYYKEISRGIYFCECYEGSRGERCEIVEQCESGEVNCGVDSGVTCAVEEDNPQAFCMCNETGKGFDYGAKKCKNCKCGRNSYGCEFRNGKQICFCQSGYFHKGSACAECKCGRGGSNSCSGKDGKMLCNCYMGYSQRLGSRCELCDCGSNASNCTFDDTGKKQCVCNPGSVVRKEYCAQECNISHRCQNGGTCTGVCQCPEGTGGDFCEKVDWCANHRCGVYGDTTCLYDKTTKQGYCGCKEPKHLYDDKLRRCFVCDCGEHGKCTVVEGGNECTCYQGYAETYSKCGTCDCGYHSVGCSFGEYSNKLCQCKEKFAQMHPSTASWGGSDDTCEPCDCGEHGRCSFDGRRKVCDCEINFREIRGECKECYCGPKGYCDFDDDGEKVCHCDYGYAMHPLRGVCLTCNCDPFNFKGTGAKCSLASGTKECECPDGFKEQFSHCEDIDECVLGPCPVGTQCVNLPGTYSCECKKGFEPMEFGLDPQRYGCKDIDECQDAYACKSEDALCVNNQGGYDCVCRDGYYPNAASSGPNYRPKYVTCYEEQTQWYVASIILGLILASTILSVSCYICSKKCR